MTLSPSPAPGSIGVGRHLLGRRRGGPQVTDPRPGRAPFCSQRDRRNLTPDQLALVRGRWYERRKVPGGPSHAGQSAGQKVLRVGAGREGTAELLARDFGVTPRQIRRDAKFAAAVETLKAIDPEIEQKVVTGKGPTRASSR